MTDLTDQQIEALGAAATPGPWVRDGNAIWQAGDDGENVLGSVPRAGTRIGAADANFIAAARSLVPSLLARAQKAEAERDEAIRDLEAGDACGAVGCRALEDRDRLLAELADVKAENDQLLQINATMRQFGDALAARLTSVEANIAEWYEREGDLLEEAKRLRSQLLTAEAKLAAVEKLCEPQSASEAAYPARNNGRLIKVGDIRAAAVLAADTTPEPTRRALESWTITTACRANRGDDGAWQEAVERLRAVYDAQVARFGPAAVYRIEFHRDPAPGVPRYVYDAAFGCSAIPEQEAGNDE